ncbi:MAG: rod-binding protein [Pseudomonadota bacterium]
MIDGFSAALALTSTQDVKPASSELTAKAEALEATFLAEMLKAAGVGKPLESFGGGPGEDAFSSFLTREYATMIAERGGIGLSEAIVRALSEGPA